MSRKYKFRNPEGIYFVSFATVYWIDVFVRETYFETMVQSLKFCRKNKDTDKNINIWLDYEFMFDDEIGTYRIKTKGNLFDTPVFFTSMLSGQRAMDNGSFERLQWHINFVLNKL